MTTEEALKKYNKIAVIGYSTDPRRPAGRIAKYMADNGYTVYGVNPKLEGECVEGIDCYKSIKDIPDEIEIVNFFRHSDAIPGHVDEVLELENRTKVIWTQLGVFSDEARKMAEENGMEYIENKCIYVEHSKMN